MKSFASEFRARAQQLTGDLRHRQLIQTALGKYEINRDRTKASFQDWQAARQAAAEIKWDGINHLDQYLVESPLGQHRPAGARDNLRTHSRQKSPVDHQVQSDNFRGNPFE